MPRQARLDELGTLHHVIIRAIEQRKTVDDDQDRGDCVHRLGTVTLETNIAMYVMRNHAHIPFWKRSMWCDKLYEKTSHWICYFLQPKARSFVFKTVLHHEWLKKIHIFRISFALYIFTLLHFPKGTLCNRVNPFRKWTGIVGVAIL